MKILIADKFEESGIDGLKENGCEVVYNPDLKDDSLVEAIRGPTSWSCARPRSPKPRSPPGD